MPFNGHNKQNMKVGIVRDAKRQTERETVIRCARREIYSPVPIHMLLR